MKYLNCMIAAALLTTGAQAQVKIMAIGDSVCGGRHLRQLQYRMESDGITNYDFVGDHAFHGFPQDTNRLSYGGARFSNNTDGRWVNRGKGLQFEPGVNDRITFYKPDVVLILGGYNNMAQEKVGAGLTATKHEFEALMGAIICQDSDAEIFVSNITDFHPGRKWAHKRQNVSDFNSFLAERISFYASNELNKVHLVDNFSSVSHSDTNSDGLHVSPSGHNKIGDNWYAALTDAEVFPNPATSSSPVHSLSVAPVAHVPEPSSAALLGLGGLALILSRRK